MSDAAAADDPAASSDLSEHWSYQEPSRWWFTTAAFPLLAGTLGPAASTFSICALVKPWRQRLPPGGSIDAAVYIPDPPWLTSVNATQLAIAILANLALLLNMTRRLRFSIAQPVTIAGWYVSAFALVGLTATAASGGPLLMLLQQGDGEADGEGEVIWSQAFYYAIYAAVLYFLIATLMSVTYISILTRHGPKDFQLTASQRTLMLQTIMFLLYLLLGALVFTAIEGWSYLDGFYWAAVTLFTVGFGDLYPTTPLARGLLVPFALIGIVSLGLVIGSIRSLVIDRGKARLATRLLEKKRKRALKRLVRQTGREQVLEPEPDDAPQRTGLTELKRREREFALMREIQEASARRRRWGSMLLWTGSWLVLWLVGGKVFQVCEAPYQEWDYLEGFYFAFISLTTIGYGDSTPISNAGKSFWVFWALMALPTMTIFISDASETVVKLVRDGTDWVARLTILPGEDSFRKDLRKVFNFISLGFISDRGGKPASDPTVSIAISPRGFGHDEHAPSVLHHAATDPEAAHFHNPSPSSSSSQRRPPKLRPLQEQEASQAPNTTFAQQPPPPPPTMTTATAKAITHSPPPPSNPSSKAAHLLTLATETRRLSHTLKHDPSRHYTFAEWVFYLGLAGEDEADVRGHRRVSYFPVSVPAPCVSHVEDKSGLDAGSISAATSASASASDGGISTRRSGGGVVKSMADVLDRHHHHDQVHNGAASSAAEGKGVGTTRGGREKAGHTQDEDAINKTQSTSVEEGEHSTARITTSSDQHNPQARTSWSWVSHKSPLMGTRNETEWILERLMARLEEELQAMKAEEEQQEEEEEEEEEDTKHHDTNNTVGAIQKPPRQEAQRD
ncbi:hypothetical protein VTJ04DRAFT_10210 [Mycothermus thermophilus]|uniref:uncharacterized protein n=1 Tax=Humicola insolens TaxID=85995 RepID=UPI0037439848